MHLGHKFPIQKFLVVGEGGVAATLKSAHCIHIVSISGAAGAAPTIESKLPPYINKQLFVDVDTAYRVHLRSGFLPQDFKFSSLPINTMQEWLEAAKKCATKHQP